MSLVLLKDQYENLISLKNQTDSTLVQFTKIAEIVKFNVDLLLVEANFAANASEEETLYYNLLKSNIDQVLLALGVGV